MSSFHLTPIIGYHIQKTLADTQQMHAWLDAFGSPLNLIFPEVAWENATRFFDVLKKHRVQGAIFYAHKANKSKAILTELATKPIHVDVASEEELSHSLSAGFSGNRIEATGPKNTSFLRVCLLHNATININSLDELMQIERMKRALGIKISTPLFLRMKTFHASSQQVVEKDQKFGLDDQELGHALGFLKERKTYIFRGFSFHITTTSKTEKLRAIEHALRWTIDALKEGLSPEGINIGGGFSNTFLQNKEEWHAYISAIKSSLLDPHHPKMSWNDSGLGFWAEQGKIRGDGAFQDFYRPINQFQELASILTETIGEFGIFRDFLSETMLTLFLEPGRSLLDQTGATVAKIISIHQSAKNEWVVFLDMNKSNMNAGELEFMADPIVIPKQSPTPNDQTTNGVYLSGNLCLPHDFICRRKVFLKTPIGIGDILAFINTAGYFMDFAESETISHPVAKKLAIGKHGWYLDERYQPSELQESI